MRILRWLGVVGWDHPPLALDREHGEVVAAHDIADALAQEHRGAAHAEVGVEVRDAHGLRVALEQGDVVCLQQCREELDEHALVALCVDGRRRGQARARRVLRVQMKRGVRCGAARGAVQDGSGRERVRAVVCCVCVCVCGEQERERQEHARHFC